MSTGEGERWREQGRLDVWTRERHHILGPTMSVLGRLIVLHFLSSLVSSCGAEAIQRCAARQSCPTGGHRCSSSTSCCSPR